MRRFLTLFVLLPIAIVVVALSVANRASVTFSLDPIGGAAPGWSATRAALRLPLRGGRSSASSSAASPPGSARAAGGTRARTERANADRLRREVERLRERLEADHAGARRPARPRRRLTRCASSARRRSIASSTIPA